MPTNQITVTTSCTNPIDGAFLLPQGLKAASHLVVGVQRKPAHLLQGGNKSDVGGVGACVSGTTFNLLGGTPGASLLVTYRDATRFDIIRYKQGVLQGLLTAVVSAAVALISA
jgi:hypothetical protein